MRTASIAFVLATLVAAVLTPRVRNIALRLGWVDQAGSSRKVHGRPVPRLGGVAIMLAFYAPVCGLYIFPSEVGRILLSNSGHATALLLGGLAIGALGIYDDLRGAGARLKFAVQFLVAGGMYFAGFRIEHVANPFGAPLVLGFFALPFTLLWIVGVINALNLIDGLDGLAGGVALAAIGITFVIAFRRPDALMIFFSATLGGAVLGFLVYNFNPASVFMGDSGSMFLGFVLATTAIETNEKASTTVAILVPIVALGVPILDTALAVARRALAGRPLFRADSEHIHHRLVRLGLTQRQAVLVLYAASVALALVALGLTYSSSAETAYTLIGLALVTFLLLRRIGYVRFTELGKTLEQRRRNLSMRAAMRQLEEELRAATDVDAVWVVLKRLRTVMQAECLALDLVHQSSDSEVRKTTYEIGYDAAAALSCERTFSLVGERAHGSALRVGWADGRASVDRDSEIAMEILCDRLAVIVEVLGLTASSATKANVIRLKDKR